MKKHHQVHAIIQGLTTNYSNLPCNDPNAVLPPLPPYLKWQYCLDNEKDTRLKVGQVPFNGGGPLRQVLGNPIMPVINRFLYLWL